MPLGKEVGLGSGDIVLDGDPTPTLHAKGHSSLPLFGPLLCLASPQARTLPITRIVIFLPCGFFYLLLFSSPNLSRRR